MVSLTEVKETKPSPTEVDKVISDAINGAEDFVKKAEAKDEGSAVNGDAEVTDAAAEGASPVAGQSEGSEGQEKEINGQHLKAAEAAVAKDESEDDDDSEEDESDSDSDSEYEDDFDPNETLTERVEALKDILSPEQRAAVVNAVSTTKYSISTFSHKAGTALWYLTTTGLLLGVPLALSILHETQLTELEKEMNLQQTSTDILTPGATDEKK
ncbi:DEKNAAC101329 [Brettanomyces naardenensis]|uniref:DEKNAAC101329 n=1 Tax=Brettanomyces naardenensis TaxID=13370 RepID=A0A448YHP7_BRENA|nr:DEKNAAC101329 [Brettanomyces naardenensis]